MPFIMRNLESAPVLEWQLPQLCCSIQHDSVYPFTAGMTSFVQIIHFFDAFREVIRHTNVRATTLTINVTRKVSVPVLLNSLFGHRLKLHRTDWQSCWQSSYPVKKVKQSVYWNCRLPSLLPSFPECPAQSQYHSPTMPVRQYGNTALLITSSALLPMRTSLHVVRLEPLSWRPGYCGDNRNRHNGKHQTAARKPTPNGGPGKMVVLQMTASHFSIGCLTTGTST